jgi:hypothetical protein
MKSAELHQINKLLVNESNKTGFDEVQITMTTMNQQTGIDVASISRIVTKLEEMRKIEVIRTQSQANTYKIIDNEIVASDYMEPLSEKQNALIRHFTYKYGFRVMRKVCEKLGIPYYIDNITLEQASDLISFFFKHKNNIECDYDDWIKTIQNLPYQYYYTHYQDMVDESIEKTIIVADKQIKELLSTVPIAIIKKDKHVFHVKTYCFTHFDLIYLGYKHHVYQGKDYYFYQ